MCHTTHQKPEALLFAFGECLVTAANNAATEQHAWQTLLPKVGSTQGLQAPLMFTHCRHHRSY
jgi:hypothetical protein